MPKITMYSTRFCPFCMRARALLERKGVAYDEIDVASNPAERSKMIDLAGRTSVPQIFVDDHHVGGSDDLAALESKGELDPLLGIS